MLSNMVNDQSTVIEDARDVMPHPTVRLQHSANVTVLMKVKHDGHGRCRREDLPQAAKQVMPSMVQFAPHA
jgi:hypothetical protein